MPAPTPEIKAIFEAVDLVIFDCDGVLVDSEPIANEVLAQHATNMGWPMDGPTSQSLFKGKTMSQIHDIFEERHVCEVSRDWIAEYNQACLQRFKTELRPIPGVIAAVQRVISSGRKICVASQGPMFKMDVTLGTTRLRDYFGDHVFSSQHVERPKPFPDLFLHAASKMDTPPNRCLVIEDSETGITAARAAGMRVLYFDPNDAGRELTTATHLPVLHDMRNLLPN